MILDEAGAEQLLGKGDGLFKPVGARSAIRVQGALVTDREIHAAVRDATATAEVEEMVNHLHGDVEEGPTVLDILNAMIEEAEKVSQRTGGYLEQLCAKSTGFWGAKGGKMDLLTQAPVELGVATDTLVHLAGKLRMIRDSALERT